MRKWLLAGTLVLAGCGGPSVQDAEEHVRTELEGVQGVEVGEVFCEEIDGDRFECSVERRLSGYGAAGQDQGRVIVEASELE